MQATSEEPLNDSWLQFGVLNGFSLAPDVMPIRASNPEFRKRFEKAENGRFCLIGQFESTFHFLDFYWSSRAQNFPQHISMVSKLFHKKWRKKYEFDSRKIFANKQQLKFSFASSANAFEVTLPIEQSKAKSYKIMHWRPNHFLHCLFVCILPLGSACMA